MSAGRFTLLMMSAALGVAGWTMIFLYFGVGTLHILAAAGAVITFAMMVLLAVSQLTHRDTAPLVVPVVVLALVLGIAVMVLAIL